jgi:hypothetical protein
VLLCYIMQTPQTPQTLVNIVKDQYTPLDLFCLQYLHFKNIQNLCKINALEIKHFLAGRNTFLHLGDVFLLKRLHFQGRQQFELIQIERSKNNKNIVIEHQQRQDKSKLQPTQAGHSGCHGCRYESICPPLWRWRRQ